MSGYYLLKKSTAVQPYYFVLRAENHETILTSENYSSRQGALNGIASCQSNSPNESRYERRSSLAAQPYTFVLKAMNGEIIGRSENYTTELSRETGIASVKFNGPTKDIRDQT